MSQSAVTAAAGCFGKIPQLGDFVSNRLPRTFVDPWDEFLRELMASSRDALGDAWLETYLHAPIWRFALGADCAGPNPVSGILMPSSDRVGRYFPLTIAVLAAIGSDSVSTDPWFDNAENLSLETLSDEFDSQTLSARLEALGRPANSVSHVSAGGCWWSFGGRSVPPLAFRAAALPHGVAATTLLDGDWQRWGWNAEPVPFEPTPQGSAV